jgi:hypothetical protein
MRPNCPLPIPHFCWLKSSVSDVGREAFEFAFMLLGTLALTVTLLLRLSLRLVTLELLVFVELRLANAMIITTRPTPMIKTAASPPRIHQTALDFFRGGAAVGPGVHAGGGCAGGGGGGGCVGRGLTTGGGG